MKIIHVVLSLALIIISLSVGYYFCIFLPHEQTHRDLTQNQASCLQMEQSIIKQLSGNLIQGQSVSGKNHYNLTLNKCFVEIDDNIVNSIGLSNDYSIYDAVEDNVLADCLITDKFNSKDFQTNTSTICFDDSQPVKNNGNPNITKSQFDSLELKYMGEPYLKSE